MVAGIVGPNNGRAADMGGLLTWCSGSHDLAANMVGLHTWRSGSHGLAGVMVGILAWDDC